MQVVGIDGCKAGWCVVSYADDQYQCDMFPTFAEILQKHSKADIILIDIPVGLGNSLIPRDLDQEARKLLSSKRRSSIFIPPVREAVESIDYDTAKEINHEVTGKKISIQSWHITRKIREVDEYLQRDPNVESRIHEAHPELCFKSLNSWKDLQFSKNEANLLGVNERLNILNRFEAEASALAHRFSKNYLSKHMRLDDIVDALCLAITARFGLGYGFSRVRGSHSLDVMGFEMGLYYFDPTSL